MPLITPIWLVIILALILISLLFWGFTHIYHQKTDDSWEDARSNFSMWLLVLAALIAWIFVVYIIFF